MWYIVFRDEFKSYGFDQGGYFVSYRDKCSDLYSPNWFEAKKYKSIGSALSRLRITIAPGMDTNEKFLAANKKINNIQSRRDIKLKGILGEDLSIIDYIFADGRIEKIGDNGELIGLADKEILEYIQNILNKNKNKMKNSFGSSTYIIEQKEGEDFWEGF
jgi:hypothetical protein